MLNYFSYVIDGVLAGSGLPRGRPEQVLGELKRMGMRTVVNLTEWPHPAAELINSCGDDCRAFHIPIPDRHAPSLDQMDEFVAIVMDPARQPVLVHCHAGIGRTGTMLAAALAEWKRRHSLNGQLTATPEEIIAALRKVRPGSIEEHVQEVIVVQYIERLKHREG